MLHSTAKYTLKVETVALCGFQLSNQKGKLTRSRSWAFQVEEWRSLSTKRNECLFTESQSVEVFFTSTWMRIRTMNNFKILILILWPLTAAGTIWTLLTTSTLLIAWLSIQTSTTPWCRAKSIEKASLACMFCFPNVGHVILLQRTVSFNFHLIHMHM